jgi:hypothetical protein
MPSIESTVRGPGMVPLNCKRDRLRGWFQLVVALDQLVLHPRLFPSGPAGLGGFQKRTVWPKTAVPAESRNVQMRSLRVVLLIFILRGVVHGLRVVGSLGFK